MRLVTLVSESLFAAEKLYHFEQSLSRGWVLLEVFPVFSLLDIGNVLRDELHGSLLQLVCRVAKRQQKEPDGILNRNIFDQKKFALRAEPGDVILVGSVELESRKQNNSKLPYKLQFNHIITI